MLALAQEDGQNRSDEVQTLLAFKQQVESGGAYLVSWKETDQNACAWAGVTCTANFTVSELDLSVARRWAYD
jgi:hypothetical protein